VAYPLGILRQRNFGLLWSSMTLAGTGMQMEALALGWLVLLLTDSPFLVGLIASARMALNFLALFSGAIADRVPRHRLLATVLFVTSLLSLGMLALLLSGHLEVWHIFALVLTGGIVRLFQMPAAQSLVADTLPTNRISNGAALTTMGMNLNTVASGSKRPRNASHCCGPAPARRLWSTLSGLRARPSRRLDWVIDITS